MSKRSKHVVTVEDPDDFSSLTSAMTEAVNLAREGGPWRYRIVVNFRGKAKRIELEEVSGA